jgi:hypothetical protein
VRRRGRTRKQLLFGLTETGGCWKLKEEALDSAVWRTGCGGDCGTVVTVQNWLCWRLWNCRDSAELAVVETVELS